jgi:Na+/proline symporter
MEGSSGEAGILWTFAAYMAAVFFLAWLSGRVIKKEGFVSEYFLGSRGFGVWALALTFAATSASGGSFMGFPARVYTHGWVVGLWIAGYMTVPLVAMALIGKRLNQVARRANALTVPEVLRERFNSKGVGIVGTLIIVVFLFAYLLAQFKAGSLIMSTLLGDVPIFKASVSWADGAFDGIPLVGNAEPAYALCLLIFGITVVAYVSYGGFRAVVWTDVMQGIVMAFGVLLLLILALYQVGGLKKATQALAEMTPPEPLTAVLELRGDLAEEVEIDKGTWIEAKTANGERSVYRMKTRAVIEAGKRTSDRAEMIRITTPAEIEKIKGDPVSDLVDIKAIETTPYASGAGEKGVYVRAPGPDLEKAAGFLAIGMAFSLFILWPFGGVGQPSNQVRMMIFDHTKVLRRAMVSVTFYFGFIYIALVLVFVCARVLMPGMEIEPDSVMPEFSAFTTAMAGVPWLAGLVVAAPYAAVMSSVDSFLLVISSSLVRDVYQRNINPQASDRTLQWMSWGVTGGVGMLAIFAAMNPPDFLQDLIISASEGLASSFLMPMILALYWQRMTGAGAIAGMIGGTGMHLVLNVVGYLDTHRFHPYEPFGVMPLFWDVIVATVLTVAVSLMSAPPERALVVKFFAKRGAK